MDSNLRVLMWNAVRALGWTTRDQTDNVIDAVADVLAAAAPSPAAEPHGWVLVPIKPTEAMLMAPDHGRLVPASGLHTTNRLTQRDKDYTAMLLAAPKPPAAPTLNGLTASETAASFVGHIPRPEFSDKAFTHGIPIPSETAETASVAGLTDAVRICPEKDTECGTHLCATCPKWGQGEVRAEPSAEHVGDTRFEGWLSCHEPDRRDGRRPAYTKQDMRDCYWAGYSERAALAPPARDAGLSDEQRQQGVEAQMYRWLRSNRDQRDPATGHMLDVFDEDGSLLYDENLDDAIRNCILAASTKETT